MVKFFFVSKKNFVSKWFENFTLCDPICRISNYGDSGPLRYVGVFDLTFYKKFASAYCGGSVRKGGLVSGGTGLAWLIG